MRGTVRYKDGNWRLQVYAGRNEGTGKKIWKTRTVAAPNNRNGRRLAEEELARLVTEVIAGQHRSGTDVTLAELLQRWKAARQAGWSPGTTYQNGRVIDQRIVPRLGAMPINRLRATDLDALYADLRARGGVNGQPLGAATVHKVHTILHSALEQAVRWQIIAVNPASHAQAPGSDETEVVPPSADDIARALQACAEDPALYAFVWLAATTGARRGQLVALRWTDLDLDAGAVTFARALVDGGPKVGVVEKSTKTKRTYSVALDPDTVAALEVHRRAHVERCLAGRLPADGFVFTREGSVPWRPDTTTKRWAALRATVGLNHVRLHDLRHFVATQLLADGVDPVTVAGRLGQSSTNMIFRRYGHVMPERDRAAAESMGSKLRGGTSAG